MMKTAVLLLFTGSGVLVGLGSCIPRPSMLSGTVDVADFTIAAGQTRTVTGNVTINASGTVEIAGALAVDADNGQSITIRAEGDVHISGSVAAGNGPTGTAGGDVTIISLNGSITITDSASIAAGNGGGGQTTASDATLTDPNGVPFLGRLITGGAGGRGGSLTLQAPNGDVNIALAADILHLGDGGDGMTIEVHGQDLLTTDTPEQLENAGGDSGVFTVEALTLNGTPLDPNAPLPPDLEVIFTGGAGGAAGDCIFGMDAEGNSTWPVPTAKVATGGNKSDGRRKKIFDDKVRTGAPGGDGFFTPTPGGNIRRAGRAPGAPGGDGENVFLFGGEGGSCTSPWCIAGAPGGDADAIGGNGAPGANPTGMGGKGGKGDATGGFGGYSLFIEGRDGNAYAHGGHGGKGGGVCPDNVADQGGRGGFGGSAFAAGGLIAIASSGNGGDGGDGLNISGPVGSPGLANAFGSQRNVAVSGKDGERGNTCPFVRALVLSDQSVMVPLPYGSRIRLTCIYGAEISFAEDCGGACDCEHVHGTISILGVSGGPFPDPDPNGCGHGCVVSVQEGDLDHDCD